MIGLLQRVSSASVTVDGTTVAAINRGLLVLVGVERGDSALQAERLAERLLAYRVFPDNGDKMNLDLTQVNGELLLVPQFTLAADTDSGNRPSFAAAANPAQGKLQFEALVKAARRRWGSVFTGVFGANMQVALINDGPVTLRLRVPPEP